MIIEYDAKKEKGNFIMKKIKVGISACLLGKKVRYDGEQKLDPLIKDFLGKYFEYIPVCPEVECGLGIPRNPMRLEGHSDSPLLIVTETRKDITKRMATWTQKRVIRLEQENLCGFIFKSNSPSCGLTKVNVFNKDSVPEKIGVGIFASIFINHFPSLPVEDEMRLHDPDLCENFIKRVFTFEKLPAK
ncbi:MAG: DUF523 domain-containing protein [Smithella sp.]